MKIKLSKKNWEEMGKKAGWHGDPVRPEEAQSKAFRLAEEDTKKVIDWAKTAAKSLHLDAALISISPDKTTFTMKVSNPLS